jgi:cytochrome b
MTDEDVVEVERDALRPGRNISRRTRFDYVFDFILLIAYGVAFSLDFTGEKWHEWFGLALGLALLVHLTLHWDWVTRTGRRIVTTTGRRRWTFVVNLLLTFDLVLCIGSGVMISRYALPSLGITFVPSQSWTNIHEKTADIAIGLIAVHLAIDWRWITTVTKRLFHLGNARPESRDHAEN